MKCTSASLFIEIFFFFETRPFQKFFCSVTSALPCVRRGCPRSSPEGLRSIKPGAREGRGSEEPVKPRLLSDGSASLATRRAEVATRGETRRQSQECFRAKRPVGCGCTGKKQNVKIGCQDRSRTTDKVQIENKNEEVKENLKISSWAWF